MNELIGRYRLLSHGTLSPDGTFTPTSDFLVGELIYSSEGHLSVLIFFNNDDSNEKRKFLAYSGTYEISGFDEVSHIINICSNSKKNSTTEVRNYKLRDNSLILSCPIEDNKMFEAKWELID